MQVRTVIVLVLLSNAQYAVCQNTFTNTGSNVGIGTTSPTYRLDMTCSTNAYDGIQVTNTSSGVNARTVLFLNNIGHFGYLMLNPYYAASGANDLILGNAGTVGALRFHTSDLERVRINANGNVGIGTSNPGLYRLAVNGDIHAKKMVVDINNWSDYVFEDSYKLRSIENLESFIKQYKHLPEIPSAKEVTENGISVGENQALLLKKIEELSLYIIELKKITQNQQEQIDQLKKNKPGQK